MSHAAHSMDLQSMHPSLGQARVLMDLYLDRVDFIFKVLHRPTLKALFASYLDDPSTLSKSNEALLLAVFFSGITCITDEECAQHFARPKMDELAHYRIAAEKALANADYLNTTDMTTLQAFCIYLVSHLLLLQSVLANGRCICSTPGTRIATNCTDSQSIRSCNLFYFSAFLIRRSRGLDAWAD